MVYNRHGLLPSHWFEGQDMLSVQICSPECISASCDIFARRTQISQAIQIQAERQYLQIKGPVVNGNMRFIGNSFLFNIFE